MTVYGSGGSRGHSARSARVCAHGRGRFAIGCGNSVSSPWPAGVARLGRGHRSRPIGRGRLRGGGGGGGRAVLPLLVRPVARLRTRRVEAAVERRLRDATVSVATVGPVRSVLRDYEDAHHALDFAGGAVRQP